MIEMDKNRKHSKTRPAQHRIIVLAALVLIHALLISCGPSAWYKELGFRSREQATSPSAIPVLVKALDHERSGVRAGAARALGEIGPEASAAVPALVEALGDKDDWARSDAAEALLKIGQEYDKAVPVIATAAANKRLWGKARLRWIDLLGKVGPDAKGAVPELVNLIPRRVWRGSREETTIKVALASLNALTKIAPESEEVAQALVNSLGVCTVFSDEVPDMIIKIEPESPYVIPELIKALSNTDVGGRLDAARTLRRLGEKAQPAVPAFVSALSANNPHLRVEAAGALGDLGEEKDAALSVLIAAIGHQSDWVRKNAIREIAKIGAPAQRIGPALTAALGDPELEIRKKALLLLERVNYRGNDLVQALKKLAAGDPDPRIRKLASDILRKVKFTSLASAKPIEPAPAPTPAPADTTPAPAVSTGGFSQRWAVVIGISQYQDTRIPALRYASVDAKSLYEWLTSPQGGRYAPSRVNLLLDREATARNMRGALFQWLGQALEEDIATVYFAGHGSPQSPDHPENLFLLPYDAQYDNIASTGFPMWDIETALKRFIKAKRVVVIADACHAAGVGNSFDLATRAGRGIKVNPISAGLQNLSQVGEGVCVISASDEKQLSQEGKRWGGGHGVFTYFLLQGLEGQADYNRDTRVTLGELIPYLSEQVRRATRNAQSPIVAGQFDPALTMAR